MALGALAAGAASGEGAARLGQTDGDTQILTGAVAGVATLPLLGGEAALRSPLVVFYEPGAQALALPAEGAGAGVLVSSDDAGYVNVADCPETNSPSPISALCLEPADLGHIGAYTGTVQLLPPTDAPGTAGAAETANGAVEVSVTVQRSLPLFIGIALLGTVLSHFAAWFAGEYQDIRKLRAQCDEFAKPGAAYPAFRCEPGSGGPTDLELVDVDKQFDQQQFKALHQFFPVLWFHSFLGKRPDYDALNKSLAAARDARASFGQLCRQIDVLRKTAEQIDTLYDQIGGSGQPALSKVLRKAITFEAHSIAPDDVAQRLRACGDLDVLSRRWTRLAEHVQALCAWQQSLTGRSCRPDEGNGDTELLPDEIPYELEDDAPPASGPPTPHAPPPAPPTLSDANEAAAWFHLMAARGKLGAIRHRADFGVLRPELDVQAAWAALEKLQNERRIPIAGGAALAEALPTFPLLLHWPPAIDKLWQRFTETLARWAPRFNTATLALLLLVSFLATLLVGLQALYLNKPWGTPLDIMVLLLVGGGIHTGLTGIAGALGGKPKAEAS